MGICHKSLRHTDEELEQRIANLEKNSADFASKSSVSKLGDSLKQLSADVKELTHTSE